MKILAIRGKNLASLEGEFEIDFTAEPLKSAGIFAITGSTGSGKSTLLDALCLALFDDTPRTSRTPENSIRIADVKNKTINQKDSRNILRRGTADGYAEADFISLGGETYRSRWSVRRSGNRADGVLQNAELRLTNRTANREEQGRKTELLARVQELIGLTFDQFTRAVLLAQGDFATFLKATQKEKAELLEKLTGTEIYSRISIAIYEKSKQAEQELELIRERIKDVELLQEEEIALLEDEKQRIAPETEALNRETERLRNKIKWMEDEAALLAGIQQAQQMLDSAQQALEKAAPRRDFLARVDSVQEIRDSFSELKTLDKQLAANKTGLEEQEKSHRANEYLLKQLQEKITLCESELRRHSEAFEQAEPEIKRARELDIRIAGQKTNLEEAEKEYVRAEEHQRKLEKTIATTQAAILPAQKTVSDITAWFDGKNQYREIIPRMDLILNLLDGAAAAARQEAANIALLAEVNAALPGEKALLDELAGEAERLNRLLPAEIAALRAKLQDGIPCPVCGSVHHPAAHAGGESLESTKLNNAKKAVAGKIAALTAGIEQRKSETIRLASVIESYANRYVEIRGKLKEYLANLSGWESLFEQGVLQTALASVAAEWKKNEATQAQANERIATLQTTLRLAAEQLLEAGNTCAAKKEKYRHTKDALESLLQKRAELLEGKNADGVERIFVQKRKKLSEALLSLKEEKDKISASNEKQAGMIKQIAMETARLSERSDLLRKTVDAWFHAEDRGIRPEQLPELLSKENAWILVERKNLNLLRQNKTAALATLNERQKNLDRHARQPGRPQEEETQSVLEACLTDTHTALRQKTARNAEIDVLFAAHRRGKERIALFEKELEGKSALSENWKKLNEMFGSADGAKFKVLAQGYTLDALLAYANRHLEELSRRYEIQRIPDTLALQVADRDMLGEIRTVHSLSGGESFLISLALALGLSSLSSNRMKVESLFIDEGFGSLDLETLHVAMDALERLQTQGRKIGVISHVPEMAERTGARIHVEKMVNGKSRVVVRPASSSLPPTRYS
jgi:exonuclease SbcC